MKKEHFIIEAIQSLVPKRTNWLLEENGNLIWGDNGPNFTPPTQKQIDDKADELELEYNTKAYQRNRSESYPAITDQLDMLWHAMDTGVLPKYEPFYNALKSVKDQYPKV